jgi:hypothetical protein
LRGMPIVLSFALRAALLALLALLVFALAPPG